MDKFQPAQGIAQHVSCVNDQNPLKEAHEGRDWLAQTQTEDSERGEEHFPPQLLQTQQS